MTIDSLLGDWKLAILSFSFHGSFVLNMEIRAVCVTFFFAGHSFNEYVKSNHLNTCDRKKISATRANFFFFNPLLFFPERLFLV